MTMAHALLGASSASRWLKCPPSARLTEHMPDTFSEYAEEGSLAHEVAELKITKLVSPMGPKTFNKKLNELKKHKLWQDEMITHTDTYKDYISAILHSYDKLPHAAVEKKVDYSNYVPEGFGTCDCIVIGGDTMHVLDFKYGKGVAVDAENNPQMKLYALGAYIAYSFIYPIKNVTLHIVQPRINNNSSWSVSIEDLLAWGLEIMPVAYQAFDGEGDYLAGNHCRFCKAKGQCVARANYYLAMEPLTEIQPALLQPNDLSDALEKAKGIVNWFNDIQEFALAECLAGKEIPGWKAVEGRGPRQYVCVDTAFNYLVHNGIEEAVLYERVPLTVPKVEKLLGSKKYKELLEVTNLVEKLPGKPTLVPASDKREPLKTLKAEDVFQDNPQDLVPA